VSAGIAGSAYLHGIEGDSVPDGQVGRRIADGIGERFDETGCFMSGDYRRSTTEVLEMEV
jgi:hypothetical protein